MTDGEILSEHTDHDVAVARMKDEGANDSTALIHAAISMLVWLASDLDIDEHFEAKSKAYFLACLRVCDARKAMR